jgi:hypothetical protein
MISLHLRAEEFDDDVRVRLVDLLQGELDLDDLIDEEAPEFYAVPIEARESRVSASPRVSERGCACKVFSY